MEEERHTERVYTIREGETLELTCLVTGHPRPQVSSFPPSIPFKGPEAAENVSYVWFFPVNICINIYKVVFFFSTNLITASIIKMLWDQNFDSLPNSFF